MVWRCREALVTVYGAWRNAALLRRRLTHLHASFAARRARLPRHLDARALLSERTFNLALLQGHGSASSSLAGTGITTITNNTNDNNNHTNKNNDYYIHTLSYWHWYY